MTLLASGAIALSQVNTELGLSSTATIGMNDSGPRGLAGKPTAASAINMSDLYGKSANTPSLAAHTISGSASPVAGTYTNTATLTFVNNGTLTGQFFDPSTNNLTFTGEWLTSPGTTAAALYYLDAVFVSGTAVTGLGTGMALSTTRSFTLSRTGFGTTTGVFSCTVKRISDNAVMAGPVNMTLSVTNSP